jgi:hypothetical protein
MCRNITPLRGLEPAATQTEIEAAALQFVRKIGALSTVTAANRVAVERAVARIAEVTADLLRELPERRNPPTLEPPLRRRARASAEA